MVTEDVPKLLVEVISVTPAMWPNWRSRGVATEEAMISALPPGRLALTEMVGKSTWGRGETGKTVYAMAPANAIPTVISVVPTGRRMNVSEMFIRELGRPIRARLQGRASSGKTGERDYRKRYK